VVPLICRRNTARDRLGFQRRLQAARVEVVVLDGVAGPRDVRLLEALIERTRSSCTSNGSEVEMPLG
jgi:hypothetical protein